MSICIQGAIQLNEKRARRCHFERWTRNVNMHPSYYTGCGCVKVQTVLVFSFYPGVVRPFLVVCSLRVFGNINDA